jgi:hypothetical protein
MIVSSNLQKVWFTKDELKCPLTGEAHLAPGVAAHLRVLREVFGQPITINSGCRSAEHNKAIKGHPRSLHVYDHPFHPTGGTAAFDIKRRDAVYDDKLIKTALMLGWTVGVANTFIHIDRRTDFIPMPQIVYYYNGFSGEKKWSA